MPKNDQFDDLFDGWGQALNVNPQLAKTVFHVESGGNPGVKNGAAGEIGPMQMKPETAKAMAVKLGFDPNAIDLHDMRWAVPLSMQYIADGLNATQTAEGALGYYNSGSADQKRWNPKYIAKAQQTYSDMALTPAGPQGATAASPDGQDATPPPATTPPQDTPQGPGGGGAPKLVSIEAPSGARVTVSADASPRFYGLINDLENAGYALDPKTTGGFNPRNIAGTNTPSEHASGNAIDVNWQRNARGANTPSDIPPALARQLAAKWGLTWGGDWKGGTRDPMHFEVARHPLIRQASR